MEGIKPVIYLLVFVFNCAAQLISIGGFVKDSTTSLPLQGVEVQLLKTGVKMVTGADGVFHLQTDITGAHQSTKNISNYPQITIKQNTCTFWIKHHQKVCFNTYTMQGRKVFSARPELPPGLHTIQFEKLPEGIFIHHIEFESGEQVAEKVFSISTDMFRKNGAVSDIRTHYTYKIAASNVFSDTLQIYKSGYIPVRIPVTSSITDTTIYLKKDRKGFCNGSWVGYTVEGAPLSYDVDNMERIICIRYELGISGLTSTVADSIKNITGLTTINNNQFSYETTFDKVTGTFSGDTTCAGTIKIGGFSPIERSYKARKIHSSDSSRSELFILVTQTKTLRGFTFFPVDTVKVLIQSSDDSIKVKAGTYSTRAKITAGDIVCQPDIFSDQIPLPPGNSTVTIRTVSADGRDSSLYIMNIIRTEEMAIGSVQNLTVSNTSDQ